MQSEESTTTTDELENMHYGAQAQGSGVLDPTTIEEGEFEAAMAGEHHDGHGMKRQADSDDDGDAESMLVEERPKKKTRGRVKIEMKFISNKLRRYTTFSKRKTGIMKKVSFSVDDWTALLSLIKLIFFYLLLNTYSFYFF